MGGFCGFYGEDEESDREDAYFRQKVWKRMITTVAGPFMNFVLAYVALVIFLMVVQFVYSVPMIYEVVPGSGAQAAGIMPGDVIVSVNEEAIPYTTQGAERTVALIQESIPEAISMTVQRDGQEMNVEIEPQETPQGWLIGINMGEPYRNSLGQALVYGVQDLGNAVSSMVELLGKMFTTGEGIEQTAGAIGLVSMMTQTVQQGFAMILNMIVVISLNLGIVNLLPLPALDGGHLLLQLIEAVRRKPMKREHEGWIHAAGFVVIIGIFVLVTYQDIVRLISGQ